MYRQRNILVLQMNSLMHFVGYWNVQWRYVLESRRQTIKLTASSNLSTIRKYVIIPKAMICLLILIWHVSLARKYVTVSGFIHWGGFALTLLLPVSILSKYATVIVTMSLVVPPSDSMWQFWLLPILTSNHLFPMSESNWWTPFTFQPYADYVAICFHP